MFLRDFYRNTRSYLGWIEVISKLYFSIKIDIDIIRTAHFLVLLYFHGLPNKRINACDLTNYQTIL